VHYPLLVAMGYAGLLPWHQGLSASAPLLVATPEHFLAGEIGVIPISQTIFSLANLVIVAGVVLITIIVMPLMALEKDNVITVPQETLRSTERLAADGGTPSQTRQDESRVKTLLLDSQVFCIGLGLIIWAYLGYLFATTDFLSAFNLNVIIAAVFGLGFFFHRTLRSYIDVFPGRYRGG